MPSEPILVVDDNAQNLKLTRLLLESEGYDVRTAEDAEQALDLLMEFRPRLILMDLQLPNMDGLSLTRLLKRDDERKRIVVIALTAYAMKGDREKALAAGCDGYVTKPIDADGLLETIAGFLGHSGARIA